MADVTACRGFLLRGEKRLKAAPETWLWKEAVCHDGEEDNTALYVVLEKLWDFTAVRVSHAFGQKSQNSFEVGFACYFVF